MNSEELKKEIAILEKEMVKIAETVKQITANSNIIHGAMQAFKHVLLVVEAKEKEVLEVKNDNSTSSNGSTNT